MPTFGEAFNSKEHAIAFPRMCVGIGDDWADDPDSAPRVHPIAKSLVNQIHELVEVADSTKSHYVRLVLLLTGAESVSKIMRDYDGGGRSRQFCKLFFNDYCRELKCAQLFTDLLSTPNLLGAVDKLYEHRCKIVHEGWLEPWRPVPWKLDSEEAYGVLRHVFVTGAVRAVHQALDLSCLESQCPGHDISAGLLCSSDACSYSETFRNALNRPEQSIVHMNNLAERLRQHLEKRDG